jgi:hypothetical protein
MALDLAVESIVLLLQLLVARVEERLLADDVQEERLPKAARSLKFPEKQASKTTPNNQHPSTKCS